MLSAVIIDSEKGDRESIIHLISVHCPNIEVVGKAFSVASGYKAIKALKPNVVFLDVRLPDGTGFELLNKFSSIDFYFIITAACEDFAIQAFKVNAIDYLLKPIDYTDLINAVSKLTKVLNCEEMNLKFDSLFSNINNCKKEAKKIVLKTQGSVYIVDIKDIIRCESKNNYTLFHLQNSSTIFVSKTLKEFDEMLSPFKFIRCHQTHLVNSNYIVKLVKHPNTSLLMTDGVTVPVSVRKKETVENLLKKQVH